MTIMSTTRRLELVKGASNKFWEIGVSGAKVTVHFGRIGTSGQSETKCFSDPAAARNHTAKKIKEKLNKGYVDAG